MGSVTVRLPCVLNCNCCYVRNGLRMSGRNPVLPHKLHVSYGTHLLDHLAADGAGLAGGQVTVVAIGQVNTDLPWCPFYILNSPGKEVPAGSWLPGANSLTGSVTISPMNL